MKTKETTSKKLGVLTGKMVAGAKALPSKTADVTKSIKDEFISGMTSVNGVSRGEGNQPPAHNADETHK